MAMNGGSGERVTGDFGARCSPVNDFRFGARQPGGAQTGSRARRGPGDRSGRLGGEVAKPWGQTTGYLRDCNGMIVEICTRSRATWTDPEQIFDTLDPAACAAGLASVEIPSHLDS